MSKQLGSAIKSMRKSRDWTQAKLGELLNVSDKTISSWEKGRTEPKLEEMYQHTFTEERQKADDEMDRYFEQFV